VQCFQQGHVDHAGVHADHVLCPGTHDTTTMQEPEACKHVCCGRLLRFTCECVAPSLSTSRGAAYATNASLCLSSALNSASLSASKALLLGSVRAVISC
jgi:hypothetical protein